MVSEALKMRNNGQSCHTDGDSESNWEGIGKNVASEAVFDTVSVFLESQNEAWEADTGEV